MEMGTGAEGGPADGFDALLDESTSGAAATDSPASEELEFAAPEPPAEPEPAEPEAEVEPEPAAAEAPKPEVPDPLLDQDIGKTRDGKRYVVSPNRLNNLIAQAKYADEIQQITPTVEQARSMAQNASEYRLMRSDYMDGEPGTLAEFAKFWHAESPEAFPAAVGAMVGHLKDSSPEAYQSIRDAALDEQADALYQRVSELQPGTKEYNDAKYRAQLFDYSRGREYRTEIKAVDPHAARLKEVERREQALQSTVKTQHDEYWKGVNRRMAQQQDQLLGQSIDEALKPAIDSKQFDGKMLDAIRLQVRHEIRTALESDLEFDRNHQLDVKTIERDIRGALKDNKRTDVGPKVKALHDAYLARATPIIRRVTSQLVGTQTKKLVQDNRATHDKLATSQKNGTAGGGRAAGKPIPAPASFNDAFELAARGK